MHCSVAECQEKVSSREFVEWMAFERLSPLDPERQDLRFALLCFHIYNLLVTDKKGHKLSIMDFMLKFEDTKKEPDKLAKSRQTWLGLAGVSDPCQQ